MCFPFFFFVHWLWPEGVFFAVGEGLSIYLPDSRFSFTPFDGLSLFFLFPPSPLDIMLLIAIHRCISWVSGEFDLYPLISER